MNHFYESEVHNLQTTSMNIKFFLSFYIYSFVKFPSVEKQVEKRTTVKKATAD